MPRRPPDAGPPALETGIRFRSTTHMTNSQDPATLDVELFEVHGRTLWMASFREPTRRAEIYDFEPGWAASPAKLAALMDECQPLAWHVHGLYAEQREALVEELDDGEAAQGADRDRLRRLRRTLKTMPEEPEEGAPGWLAGLDAESFARVIDSVRSWLDDEPDWISGEEDYFPEPADKQSAALEFFRNQSDDVLDALHIEIVEGEHPGSSYYAAELAIGVDEANRIARQAGIPVRFVASG